MALFRMIMISSRLVQIHDFFLSSHIWLRRSSLECGHQRILSLRFCCLWQYRRYDKTNNFAWLSAKVPLRNRTEPQTADMYHSTDMDLYQPRSSMVRSLLIFELCKGLKKNHCLNCFYHAAAYFDFKNVKIWTFCSFLVFFGYECLAFCLLLAII